MVALECGRVGGMSWIVGLRGIKSGEVEDVMGSSECWDEGLGEVVDDCSSPNKRGSVEVSTECP